MRRLLPLLAVFALLFAQLPLQPASPCCCASKAGTCSMKNAPRAKSCMAKGASCSLGRSPRADATTVHTDDITPLRVSGVLSAPRVTTVYAAVDPSRLRCLLDAPPSPPPEAG